MKQYQECSRIIKIYRWLRWMPYAYIRGIYWYLSGLTIENDELESLSSCISISIGIVQGCNMNWTYTMNEVLERLDWDK